MRCLSLATVLLIAISAPIMAISTDVTALEGSPTQRFQQIQSYIFTDVPSSHWAATPISIMTQAHIMSGYKDGSFKPDKPMTREEAAALFNNIMGNEQPVMLSSSFSDITSDRWSALAIEAVAQKNIISGYGDNTYKPEKYMSRQEFAVVADNYLHYKGYTTEDPTILDDYAYADQKFVAPWAQDAVWELASLGILLYDKHSLFNPEKYITRAEAASIAYRLTYSPQTEQIKDTIFKQETERKAVWHINQALHYDGDFNKFRSAGAMYWIGDTLHIAVKKSGHLKLINSAIAMSHDSALYHNVIAHLGKYSQEDFDELQVNTTAAYREMEPKGHVISVTPNPEGNLLILTVNTASDTTVKAFNKKFNKKATLQVAKPTDDKKITIPYERRIPTI